MEQSGPTKDPEIVRAMFARIARRYDLNNRLHSLWRDQVWRRAAAGMARVRPGQSVLDVACGTGDLTAMLAKTADRVVGADFCPEMLEIARRKFARLPIEWVQADAHAIPFPDGSFDAITIAFGLRNLADPRRALAEFSRLLRPGGRLVVLEFTPGGRGWGGRAIAWFTRHVMIHTASIIAGERFSRIRQENSKTPVRVPQKQPQQKQRQQQKQDMGKMPMLQQQQDAGETPATHEGKMPSTHAWVIAGEGGGAYDYLNKSVQSFLTAEQVSRELARAGLTRIEIREMTFGTIAICRGVKE